VFPKWERSGGESPLGWDVSGYYWYLPSLFVYQDLKHQEFGDSIIQKYQFSSDFSQSFVYENGNRVMNYSAGMAVMYLPAFTIAHFIAKPLGHPADGFSKPYQVAVHLSGILMALIGLWYFRKLLLLFFSDQVVAICLLLLVFGTNYLNYTAVDASLTHNWLFSIYVLLLLATIRFYKVPSTGSATAIGILIGLAILIRPSEIIAILIPLLWGMDNIMLHTIKGKLKFFLANKKYIFITAFFIIAIGSIQIIYWLYVAGKPLVYSYQEKGFSWFKPHIWNYALSYKSGWLTYTPIMFCALIGIIPFIKNGRNKVAILAFSVINFYIVSAWDIWWYGGTGGRAMIQSYPVMFFFLAAFIQYILRHKISRLIAAPFILVFVYVNIWFTYQAHAEGGLYDPEGMSKAYYWHVVGRWKVADEQAIKYKDTDEFYSGDPKNKKLLYAQNFEIDSCYTGSLPPIEGSRSCYIDFEHAYSPNIRFRYNGENADWLRAEVLVYSPGKEWTAWMMTQYIVAFIDKDNTRIKDRMIRLQRFMERDKKERLFFDIKIPRQDFDTVEVFFWNPGSSIPVLIDDIKVYSFQE
jgi:hypothetical protein